MVPRRTASATPAPSASCRRVAISSAALLVKVTAQILSGLKSSFWIRYRMRPMRQKVLPAPGPATTSTGPSGASMARRCCGRGRKDIARLI